MCWSSSHFSGLIRLKGKSRKTCNLLMSVYLNFDLEGCSSAVHPLDVSLTATSRSLYLRLKRKISNNLPSQLLAPSHSSNLSDAYRLWNVNVALFLHEVNFHRKKVFWRSEDSIYY